MPRPYDGAVGASRCRLSDKKDAVGVRVIGGGLAGSECAWQVAQRGVPVELIEMRPLSFSPVHASEHLAELVCSNSFRAASVDSAVGLLKEEMRRLGSLTMAVADATSVPAGRALAVDRKRFAAGVTTAIEGHALITLHRQEVKGLAPAPEIPTVLATGPLTSEPLAASLGALTGADNLAFYDAIAPIIDAESIDMDICYRKSRWQDEEPGDYLNCPMNREAYEDFLTSLKAADKVPLQSFEEARYFEGCLPIEVMAERGRDTLRFGPMKPVGLAHPHSGERFHAVVQLRAENRAGTAYNLVGFQTKLTQSAQRHVFRKIPGLGQAQFLRYGSIHRNTFIRAPSLLLPTLQLRVRPRLFLAGQLAGVEGYVESAAMGLLAGINAASLVLGKDLSLPPAETAHGALITHLTASDPARFQPSNVNFGLFPPLEGRVPKQQRGRLRADKALRSLERWRRTLE
ncbi:MAG: methylenetetrahydrofolate--tRNA-(uracil(54)-C(5))-methyltransferase (FADH(2)-oxidizing) TrmFO [Desulfobulbus propionicus]|nr:MAG: methylenetetrahydrofolate--tRNA-(uracil(54)-C(5))-methyltransferase (FADH(2)-oxidizing) TrmFO [Desulfobulbus propionicus]